MRIARFKSVSLDLVLCACILLGACTTETPKRASATPPEETKLEPVPLVARIPSPAPSIAPEETSPIPEPAKGPVEIFPHVRLDAQAKLVEFDGSIPIDCHNPRSPRVYLEVVACLRNTKEHEALVVTDALPSHVHTALLAAGLVPGKPGAWKVENHRLVTIPPEGARVRVTIAWRDERGNEVSRAAEAMILSAETKRSLSEGDGRWLFSGSRLVPFEGREFYDADGMGTLIGLSTFGAETIAWSSVMSPEASVEDPEWIADGATVPPFNTPVVVRIESAR